MHKLPFYKYRPFTAITLPDRQWPSRVIEQAPLWCSVDLRDGNQALVVPMTLAQKLELFNLLVKVGFKQIEVGFPSAAEVEFNFLRTLVEENRIPEDVTIQVLTQAREHLIRRTFESVRGAKQAIIHLYNPTSELQRRVVFKKSKPEIIEIAAQATQLIKELASTMPETKITLEYSPESFSGTEVDFAVEICEAVIDVWKPTPDNKIILNLPETVQLCTPNTYADQIEWFCRRLKQRDLAIVSLHTHNDRGTGVASTELGMMAGAERVEGTLLGNGERTGNVDLVTVALNLYTQGIDPNLDLSNIDEIVDVVERCTNITTHIRHPYVGELVFTAFSGSHQDAISKGMAHYTQSQSEIWEVPYLPMDPTDIGRTYESIIRVNSQSGKGGIAYLLDQEFGFQLPKPMQPEFGQIIQRIADHTGKELKPAEIWHAFFNEYIDAISPLKLQKFRISESSEDEQVTCDAEISIDGNCREITGRGNGPIDALAKALQNELGIAFELTAYYEHALSRSTDAKAAAYIQVRHKGTFAFGVGVDPNISLASGKALLSALNRSLRQDH
ncbi:2-isopropylmalate synthase [Leptolyngbya sp. FACHB-261]|uniref:2-isopropylmalate synthase n=1 Tax=Leptolyngbya sp. FACHB-261 TaxID=2692806 RepID=UPI00168352AD|nr:2-isopropylmalate synthase [Leptolyngbya sp. FACHB-261]MBD2103531.1 2-isopropylmalate synthase [Leptolyngbya sp. FACHB-261]